VVPLSTRDKHTSRKRLHAHVVEVDGEPRRHAIFSERGSQDSILVILEHRIEELLGDYFLLIIPKYRLYSTYSFSLVDAIK
jgi:hypothetical protein